MTKKKILCMIISVLLLGTTVCSVWAADRATNIGTATETAAVGNMERISERLDWGFEIISTGRDSVVAEFTASGRITDPPYVGEKGTKNTAEKVSNLQYVLEYDKEYSFVYTVAEDGHETVYNSFLTVERGSDIKVAFGDIVKNEIPDESTRAAGTRYESESNNTLATADITYDDYDNIGALTTTSDVDWWRVSFTQAGRANFWLGNIPTGCDYDLTLYDAAGTELDYSWNSDNEQELIQYEVTPNVYYYIEIKTYEGSSNSQYLFRTKNYPTVATPSITINFSSNVPTGTKVYVYRENDTGASAMKVPDGVLVSGNSISIQNYSATWKGASETNNITIGKSYAINIVAPGKAVEVIHPFTIPASGNYSINVTLSNKNIIFSSPFTTYTSPSIMSCQNYGYRYDSDAQRDYHAGIDISKPQNTPINSICDVSSSEFSSGYNRYEGNYVCVVDSETGYTITYKHQNSLFEIDEETSIGQGECIGYVGTTGDSTGYHLHIDIQDDDGNYFDPEKFW